MKNVTYVEASGPGDFTPEPRQLDHGVASVVVLTFIICSFAGYKFGRLIEKVEREARDQRFYRALDQANITLRRD